ncbi:MAG: phosphoenolpyruvate carboxykinase (ATP) [Thermotogae bacterium]|nr:phosphoenolpyruvate carboxykinase (ATP) [Thermotogota bacterium]
MFPRINENWSRARLVERAVEMDLGKLAHFGSLVVITAPYTGRSPKDRFFVKDDFTENLINWNETNVPFSPEAYDRLRRKVLGYLFGREVFLQQVYVGADPSYRLGVEVYTESPWHALFVRNMFILPDGYGDFSPHIRILHAPYLKANPEEDGTRSEAFVILNFKRREVIIGGTAYGGEIKKSVFTYLNYYYPHERGVLSMHAGANMGRERGDVAVFFGLSGTGKTTLSTDPERPIIGDDELGWTERGIFNFEGGCYAKVIRLGPEKEPGIYRAVTRFGAILENVVMDEESRQVDFSSAEITENTRGSYPLEFLDNYVPEGMGPHPKNIFFLSLDAYGVLPPIAKLTEEQIKIYFLAGYTSKIAGTERGIKEPQPTFSIGFAEPFLPLHPKIYADMLFEKVKQHGTDVWLVNTGWVRGPYGEGERIPLRYTRRLVNAAINGEITEFEREPHFGLLVPKRVEGVPDELLMPERAWRDKRKYAETARKIRSLIEENARRWL